VEVISANESQINMTIFSFPPAFFLRLTVELPVIEFDLTLHVSSEALSGRYEKDKRGLGPQLHKLMLYLSVYRRWFI
jgi:hypothetical protein